MEKLSTRLISDSLRNKAGIIFCASIIILLLNFTNLSLNPDFTAVVGSILLFLSLAFFGKSITWKKGAEGEEAVVAQLRQLNNVTTYHDIHLPSYGWNIDHVILSDRGIYVAETKNYAGEISQRDGQWINRIIGRFKIFENK